MQVKTVRSLKRCTSEVKSPALQNNEASNFTVITRGDALFPVTFATVLLIREPCMVYARDKTYNVKTLILFH